MMVTGGDHHTAYSMIVMARDHHTDDSYDGPGPWPSYAPKSDRLRSPQIASHHTDDSYDARRATDVCAGVLRFEAAPLRILSWWRRIPLPAPLEKDGQAQALRQL